LTKSQESRTGKAWGETSQGSHLGNAIFMYGLLHHGKSLKHFFLCSKQRLKFKFPSVTTAYHHTRPFESSYYYLHDNAKHPVPDILRNKLRRWLAQERLYRGKEFEDGKPPAEISPMVDNLVRLLIGLIYGSPSSCCADVHHVCASVAGEEFDHIVSVHGYVRVCLVIRDQDFEC